jgi:hypothetical protein
MGSAVSAPTRRCGSPAISTRRSDSGEPAAPQCGREGVHVSRHNLILGTLASCPQKIPWNRSSSEPRTGTKWVTYRS